MRRDERLCRGRRSPHASAHSVLDTIFAFASDFVCHCMTRRHTLDDATCKRNLSRPGRLRVVPIPVARKPADREVNLLQPGTLPNID